MLFWYNDVVERRQLDEMPFDKVFEFEGNDILCHATGYEVLIEGDDTWWNEYILPDGSPAYGR